MKKRTLFLIACVLLTLIVIWRVTTLFSKRYVPIDNDLEEISGIEFDKNNDLWAINDGGNSPEIHQIDTLGKIKRSIRISNAKNVDWEDMTQDYFGHFFIGDFGNNNNQRTDLTIYKIENPIDIKTDSTEAEIIRFVFDDQDLDSKHDSLMNFDLEAFIFYKVRLYLFTKNRTKPFDGYTNLFRMEDYASNQRAEFIGRFKTCDADRYQCWITGAALSPDRTTMALLGSNKVWLFRDWKEDNFFTGTTEEKYLGMITQKEAITFYNDSLLIIADEKFKGVGGNIYTLKVD